MNKTLSNLLNHERYQSISIIIICSLLIWMYACESKVQSIQDPRTKVTRGQLEAEINYILSQAELRYSDLDRQDAIKQALTKHALLFAQGGAINPVGLIATMAGLFGIGATVDNVRKRKVIKTELAKTVESANNKTSKC